VAGGGGLVPCGWPTEKEENGAGEQGGKRKFLEGYREEEKGKRSGQLNETEK